jgi:cation diffusion facilitator family transporter
MSSEGGTKAVVAALIANLGIAVAKFVAFAFTGSSSMLSEGIHSVADSANQVLLLIGGRRSKRAPDANHPFGFGRTRYLYGFVVAIVLFLVGGLFSVYEGIHKIQHPEPLTSPAWAFGVLILAIILESFSFRTAIRESDRTRGNRSWFTFVHESRSPELPVVLLEDAGALVGLVLAIVGVSLAEITGDGRWDGVGSFAIGTLLIIIAIFLSLEMSSMLVGEGALPGDEAAIRKALEDEPGIDRVIHLRTLHLGPDQLLVAAKIAIGPADTAVEVANAIDSAEARLRAVVPSATYVFLEPDIDRNPTGGSPAETAADTP